MLGGSAHGGVQSITGIIVEKRDVCASLPSEGFGGGARVVIDALGDVCHVCGPVRRGHTSVAVVTRLWPVVVRDTREEIHCRK